MSSEKNDDKWFGSSLVLKEDVKYIGDGQDPAKDPYMMAYARALKQLSKEYKDLSWLKD